MPVHIAFTSDLHYDPTGSLTLPSDIAVLVEEIRAKHVDAVVIAGDLAHGLDRFRACLELFADLNVPIGVLAGNHDVWRDKRGGHNSADLWHKHLPQVVRDAGAIWLEEESLTLGNIAIVGSMAWYDYSAVDPGVSASVEDIAAHKRRVFADAHWIDWEYEDRAFAMQLQNSFQQRLDAARDDPAIKNIVVVTHVPLVEGQITRKPHDRQWGLTNAYFGNLTAGKMVLAYDKVSSIVSGHTHIGRQGVVERISAPSVDYCVIPSDYGKPAYITLAFEST